MATARQRPRDDTGTADPRWAAVLARDASADGTFVYSVRSTGVYCRPSCPSRRARRANVAFHATAAEAERAGFRPCRRCHPEREAATHPHAALVAALCRRLDAAERAPTLARAGRELGQRGRAFHLQRVFKALTGLSPRDWARARRAERMQRALEGNDSVTAALYDAGYGSSSRFYEEAGARLGMTPRAYRAGGAATAIRFAVGQCSLGAILVAQSARGVCAILLGDDPNALIAELQRRFPAAELRGGDAGFETLVARVVGFVEAPRLGLDLPLDLRGTAFQQRVWQALRMIPPGQTLSYAELAERIGAPKAVRAVAGACAANPLAVAIPCHRVVRRDGDLAGYRWGIARKRALLEREASA